MKTYPKILVEQIVKEKAYAKGKRSATNKMTTTHLDLSHWGGVAQAWSETLDAQEDQTPPKVFDKLRNIDQVKLPEELPAVLACFSWQEINFLNSPLLDTLFRLITGYHPKDGDRPYVYVISSGQNWSYLIEQSAKYGLEVFRYLVGKDEEKLFDLPSNGNALCIAAGAGQEELVYYLIDHGVDPKVFNGLALVKAVKYPKLVKYFHEKGVLILACNGEALKAVIYHQCEETLSYLLEHGRFHRGERLECFQRACLDGFLPGVKLLLEPRADFLNRGLETAIYGGHLEVVDYLSEIKQATMEDPAGWKGRNHFYWREAIRSNRLTTLQHLRENNFPFLETKSAYIYYAAEHGSVEVVNFLWEAENQLPDDGAQNLAISLLFAARAGNLPVLRFLVEKGVRETPERRGNTIEEACTGGHLEIVELLLETGFDYDKGLASSFQGRNQKLTDLMMSLPQSQPALDKAIIEAVRDVHLPVVKNLLALGAICDFNELLNWALNYSFGGARVEDKFELVKFLLDNGAGPSRLTGPPEWLYLSDDADLKKGGRLLRLLLQNGFSVGTNLEQIMIRAIKDGDLETFRMLKGIPSKLVLLVVIQEQPIYQEDDTEKKGEEKGDERGEENKEEKKVDEKREERKDLRLSFLQEILARKPVEKWTPEEQDEAFRHTRDKQMGHHLIYSGFVWADKALSSRPIES